MNNRQDSEETIFTNARQMTDAAERERYLQKSCGADVQLLDRIRRLLRVHAEDTSFLEAPIEATAMVDLVFNAAETAGSVIGPYELIEQIGAGGMGLVFLAQQGSPVRRQVALKIIRPGMDTRTVILRFESERQTLAQLNHPGITQLLDAGTTSSGRPWFVMELAQGPSITEFCRQKSLSVAERLRLFELVCDAVQHAHQKGVLHRDIKPANVVVTTLNGRPAPKVIDFGVARVTRPEGKSDPEQAAPNKLEAAAIMGTPAYMSPEQTCLPDDELDARCDVYSLGVLLYELLTDISPFNGMAWLNMTSAETLQTIRERVPPLPSEAVSSHSQSAGVHHNPSEQQEARSTSAESRLLKGDLDWITMKALHKDRDGRYATVAALAADVRRYLQHEPVEAGPPSMLYRLKKFVRRRKSRIAIASLTAGLLTLMLTAALTMWSLSRERAELARLRQLAEEQNRRASEQAALQRSYEYAEDIQSAYASYHQGDLQQTRRLLAKYATPAEAEDEQPTQCFEWRLLDSFSRSRPQTLKNIDGKVFDVKFSPDSRLLASCTGDRAYGMDIWNATDGTLMHSVLDFENDVNSLCFSQDGTLLLTAEEGRQVRAWNPETGSETAENRLNGFLWPVARIHLGADSRVAMISQVHWPARIARTSVRTLGTGDDQMTLEGQRLLDVDQPRGIAAFAANSGEISLRRLDDLSLISIRPGKLRKTGCGCFSGDGELLACGDLGGDTTIWKLSSNETSTLPRHSGGDNCIRDLVFSPDSRYLITASNDGTVEVWDTANWTITKLFHSSHGEAWSVDVSADGRRFVIGYQSGHIQVYDWADVEKSRRTIVRPGSVLGAEAVAAASPDAHRIAVLDETHTTVRILSTDDGRQLQSITAPETARLTGLAFSHRGDSLWVCSEMGRLMEIDLDTADVIQRIEGRGMEIPLPFMLATESLLAVSSLYRGEHPAVVRDTTSQAKVFQFSAIQQAWHCIWGIWNDQTALTSQDRTLARWNLQTGQEILPSYTAPHRIDTVGMLPRQDAVLLGLADGTLHVFDVAKQQTLGILTGHRGIPSASTVSPDGQTLATGSRSGDVRLWRLSTLQPLCELAGLTGQVTGLWFSGDGERLIAAARTSGGGGEVIVWDASRP